MKTTISILFFTLVTVAACGLLGKDEPDPPDIPGKIVVAAEDENGFSQIYTMNANGTGLRQLTYFVGGGAVQPAWSPDGSRIAFAGYAGATTLGPYLYIMDADGKNMRFLKRFKGESPKALVGNYPDWSPDGSKIVYTVCTNCELGSGNYEIVIVEVAGEVYDPDDVYPVTDNPFSDRFPTWSPVGDKIAFIADKNPDDYETDLYMMNADGSNVKRLTEFGLVGSISWHPNQNEIFFATINGIFKYNLQIKKVSALNLNVENARPISWSKDGKYLLLSATFEYPKDVFYLFTADSNTTKRIPFEARKILGSDWIIPKGN